MPPARAARHPAAWTAGLFLLGAVSLALGSGRPGQPTAKPPAEPTVDGRPLFADWPKDAKPDAVLVLSGQTFGYLQPCGCSRPQLGGLERRAVLVQGLKAKGWPVAGVDVGDVPPFAGVVPEQVLLKYATAMAAMREMGYVAVGLGKAEFNNGVYRVLGGYANQKEQPPYVLAGNVGGLSGGKVTPRAEAFPGPGTRPMVGLAEVVEVGKVPVGVVGVVAPSVQTFAAEKGGGVGFTPVADALAAAAKELDAHPKKPKLRVLLFQGTAEGAKNLAAQRSDYAAVLCVSDDSEPPPQPDSVAGPNGHRTLVIQVGHKGRYVGVLGAFAGADGAFALKYQLVPLGEFYVTPGSDDAARKANPALGLLDDYAARVRGRNLMGQFPQRQHPAQAGGSGLTFVGSDKCVTCHAEEAKKWEGSKHGHAFDALEKVARRPAGRQFDGECIVCHTVGFGYRSGYRDEATTAHLKHVGCESCHGPGSGHAADPKNAKFLALQSPWRADRADRLPDVATLARLAPLAPADQARALTPAQVRTVNAVSRACAACHDTENDPRFDVFTYWPQVAHGGKK